MNSPPVACCGDNSNDWPTKVLYIKKAFNLGGEVGSAVATRGLKASYDRKTDLNWVDEWYVVRWN